MTTATFTGTLAGAPANGTIYWPDSTTYQYPQPVVSFPTPNQTAEFAKVALQGLLSHDAHLLLSEAELCDKAWRIAKEMRQAATRCGEWV